MLTQKKGQIAEDQALVYLQAQGFKLVTRNYSCRLGEIDLIMRDKDYLVFIEVRSRVSADFGGGIASITYAKRQKIIKSATCFVMSDKALSKLAWRFDVVSIDGKSAKLTWIKDAFGLDY